VTISFTNPRRPKDLSELSDIQQKQLVFAGERYDGVTLSAAERLSEERADEVEDTEEGMSFYGMLELWDVLEGGAHIYDALLYMADSGVLLEKGSTRLVTERIQTYFSGGDGTRADDDNFGEALDKAYRDAKKKNAAQLKSTAKGPWGAYEKALEEAQKSPAKKPTTKKPTPAKKAVTKKPAVKKAKSTTKKTAKKK
jgi:hypothetical protein